MDPITISQILHPISEKRIKRRETWSIYFLPARKRFKKNFWNKCELKNLPNFLLNVFQVPSLSFFLEFFLIQLSPFLQFFQLSFDFIWLPRWKEIANLKKNLNLLFLSFSNFSKASYFLKFLQVWMEVSKLGTYFKIIDSKFLFNIKVSIWAETWMSFC